MGAWDKEKAGWVNRLAIYCQNKNKEDIVYNLGIPSETTSDLIKRIKNECESRNPNTVIISIGINDALYLNDIEKNKTDIETFEKAKSLIGDYKTSFLSKEYKLTVVTDGKADTLAQIFSRFYQNKVSIHSFSQLTPNLEDAFLTMIAEREGES